MKKFIFAIMSMFLLTTAVSAADVPLTQDDNYIIKVVDNETQAETIITPINDVILFDATLMRYKHSNKSFKLIKEKSYLDFSTNTIVDTYQLDNNKTLTVEYSLYFNNSCFWSTSNGTVSVIDTAGPGAVVTYYNSSGQVTRRYTTSDAAARDVCAMMK